MQEILQDGSFETTLPLSPWTAVRLAEFRTERKRTGSQSLRLQTNHGIPSPLGWGEIQQEITDAVPGETYEVSAWYNPAQAYITSGVNHRLQFFVEDALGGWTLKGEVNTNAPGPDTWLPLPIAPFDHPGIDPFRIRFRTESSGGFGIGTGYYWVDDASIVGLSKDELVARSNMGTWLANLKAKLEAIDPNIGKVFLAERRWSTAEDLHDDGAIVEIGPGGLFDSVEELGPMVRFWILEPSMDIQALTTCSDQWNGRVNIVGFYGWKENHSQAETLREVALEILAILAEKATELTDLGAGMGDGYMGYLTVRPRMLAPVRSAQLLGTQTQGHTVQILASYSEEVSR